MGIYLFFNLFTIFLLSFQYLIAGSNFLSLVGFDKDLIITIILRSYFIQQMKLNLTDWKMKLFKFTILKIILYCYQRLIVFQLFVNFHIISIILKSFEKFNSEFLIKLIIKKLYLISLNFFFALYY